MVHRVQLNIFIEPWNVLGKVFVSCIYSKGEQLDVRYIQFAFDLKTPKEKSLNVKRVFITSGEIGYRGLYEGVKKQNVKMGIVDIDSDEAPIDRSSS